MRVRVTEENFAAPLEYIARTYAPEMASSATAFSRATYEHSALSLREFEAARLRVAQINGCQLCQNWRSARDAAHYVKSLGGREDTVASRGSEPPTEAFYTAISAWRSASVFTARERLAIEFAERFCADPQGLARDEHFWANARAHYADREIVDLSYCVACWMALGRLAHVLGADAACQIPALSQERRAS